MWGLVDAGTETHRLSVCAGCPSYQHGRCAVCGCFMALKAKLAGAACPLGKWPASPVNRT